MHSIGFSVPLEFMFEIGDTTQERFPHHVSLIIHSGMIRDCNKPPLMITHTPLSGFYSHYSHYSAPYYSTNEVSGAGTVNTKSVYYRQPYLWRNMERGAIF